MSAQAKQPVKTRSSARSGSKALLQWAWHPENYGLTSRTGCRLRNMPKAMRLLIDRKAIGRVALVMR